MSLYRIGSLPSQPQSTICRNSRTQRKGCILKSVFKYDKGKIAAFSVSPPGADTTDDVLEVFNIRDKTKPMQSTLMVHNNYGGGFADDSDRVALQSILYAGPSSAGNTCSNFVRSINAKKINAATLPTYTSGDGAAYDDPVAGADGVSIFDDPGSSVDDIEEMEKLCIPLPRWAVRAGARQEIHFNPERAKVAIVTCGGLCPGLNDIVQGLVTKLVDYGVPEQQIYGIKYGFKGLYSRKHPPVTLTKRAVEGIHLEGGTILGTSRGGADMAKIVKTIDMKGLDMLFVVGGNGGNAGAAAIDEMCRANGVVCSVVGVPKSIDNDILLIDKCFGFDTAVEEAQRAIMAAKVESSSACRGIGLVKLMGRESGFIAMEASLASGVADVCLIPEVDFILDGRGGVFQYVEKKLQSKGHCVICIAEGAGQRHMHNEDLGCDESGNPRLGDIGIFLKDKLKRNFKGADIKYIDPTYMIRAIPCTATDRIYCKQLASNAVHAAFAGFTGVTIGKVNTHFVILPTEVLIQATRKVDPHGKMWNRLRAAIGQPNFHSMRSQRSQDEQSKFERLGQALDGASV